ncbi:hypothetical protein ACS5PN_03515 [Roseateles sp. NT4]|uniref:hypothetical protein n=1 Tax=Roseateles sp. NT4 TaxID=3453715 RepID=UPI003EE9CEF1
MALFRHYRLIGTAASASLAHARRDLMSGDWPDEIAQRVAPAYAGVMQQVLIRAQYAGSPTGDPRAAPDRAYRLARSVRSWVLPEALQEQLEGAQPFKAEAHRAFSRAWCESSATRAKFASAAAEHLVESRAHWPEPHRALVEHLCTFTQCFGGVHT